MKRLVYILIALVVIIVVVMTGYDKPVQNNEVLAQPEQQDDSIAESEPLLARLTFEERKAKLLECAGCHPKEHENELIGPHANSYKKLLEHEANADTSTHFPREYAHFVHKNIHTVCNGCHAPENLYETVYAGLDMENDTSKFTEVYYSKNHKFPPVRKDSASRILGIDCLSCHAVGNRVVTSSDYINTSGMVPPCNPLASKFFSANDNCKSCHLHTNNNMADNIHEPELKRNLTCNSCHMEKDVKGEYTHYYYWRNDPPSKKQFPLLKRIFTDVNVKKDNTKPNTFLFTWKNKQSPHGFSECAEAIVEILFLDKNGKILFAKKERLNNKKEHDSHLASTFANGIVPGEIGHAFMPNDKEIIVVYTLKDETLVSKIIITGYEKPQYWLDDLFAKKIYSRTIEL